MDHVICYISNVSPNLQEKDINKLLKDIEEKNKARGLHGVLLYSEGNFFQVLEGEKKLVLAIWQKIEKDPRHYGIIQVMGRDTEKSAWDGYKADILNEEKKMSPGLPVEYIEPLKGMSLNIQNFVKGMMENFIITRNFRSFNMSNKTV